MDNEHIDFESYNKMRIVNPAIVRYIYNLPSPLEPDDIISTVTNIPNKRSIPLTIIKVSVLFIIILCF